MPNALTLTSFAENIYRARDIVSREAIGFIPSVLMNSDSVEVSINGTINSLTTAEPTLNTSYAPAMTIPSGDDQTVGNATTVIDQIANVRIPLRGEDVKKMENVGMYQTVIDDMFAQAFRKISNAIEAHTASVARLGASRAIGTSGTTPFASTVGDTAQLGKILTDNGAGLDERKLVINTTSGAALRTLAQLTKVNEGGSDATLRRGELLDLNLFQIRESAGIATTVAGTGSGYLINLAAGYAVGATALTVDTGTGTILAGDVITIGGHQYVVAAALAASVVTIAAPGLQSAVADNTAITVTAAFSPNVGFRRNAIELIIRPPSQPLGGDAAQDRMVVTDPVSGLVYSIGLYKGYGMNMLDFTTFYKAKVWKPEHVAILKG